MKEFSPFIISPLKIVLGGSFKFFFPNFSWWLCKLFKLNKFNLGLLPNELVFSGVKKESSSGLSSKIFSYVQI